MKSRSLIQKIFAFALTAMVLFTVTVRETHYLFSEHHSAHERCENHLHQADSHGDCSVCKFDVSLFTDCISFPEMLSGGINIANRTSHYQSVILSGRTPSNPLRGPPAFA